MKLRSANPVRALWLRLSSVPPAVRGAGLVGVLLLLIWGWLGQWYQDRLLAEHRVAIAEEVSLRENALALAINRRVALLRGLYAFVKSEALDDQFGEKFDIFAAELYAGSQDVNYLALAPNGVIQYIYPPEMVEIYLRRDLLNDPRQTVRSDVHRAIRLQMTTVTTPYELLDGNVGVAARLPVYEGDQFWGLVTVAINLSTLLEEAGLAVPSETLDFALRGSAGDVFFGSTEVFGADPIIRRVDLPDSSWELAAVPRGGWSALIVSSMVIYRVAGLLMILLLSGLTYLFINRQEQLQQAAALRERQKLARELHDSVSQAVYGIALSARTAHTLLSRSPQQAAEPLEYVLTLAEAALTEMRALVFELRPDSLETEGLVAALAQQADMVHIRHDLEVITSLPDDEPPLRLSTKQMLYRIAQEALHNVVKHARAQVVHIRLSVTPAIVRLEIEDDGHGFDPLAAYPGHFGLTTMRERAERLRGSCEIRSSPEMGTCIVISVPVQ